MRGQDTRLLAILLFLLLLNISASATVAFKTAVTYPVGTTPRAVAAGDFNGDGKVDLVVANAGNAGAGDDGSVSVLLGNGDGTFQPANNIPAGKNPTSIAVGDSNGDNRPTFAALSCPCGRASLAASGRVCFGGRRLRR
jgi:hypothetical protein